MKVHFEGFYVVREKSSYCPYRRTYSIREGATTVNVVTRAGDTVTVKAHGKYLLPFYTR